MANAVRPVEGDLGRRLAALERAIAKLARFPTGKNAIGPDQMKSRVAGDPASMLNNAQWESPPVTGFHVYLDALGVAHVMGGLARVSGTGDPAAGDVLFTLPIGSDWNPNTARLFIAPTFDIDTLAYGSVVLELSNSGDMSISSLSGAFTNMYLDSVSWLPATYAEALS